MNLKFDPHDSSQKLINGVFCVERNCRGSQCLFLVVGTHGQEIAGPLALKRLLEVGWRWPNVQLVAVWQDPRGYEEEGYGFISTEGQKSCWPPLAGYRKNEQLYWLYQDENSAWGMTVNVPPSHQAMRDLMEQCRPTFCLSLHETVRSEVERDLFWAGADLLLIETWPIMREYATVGGYSDSPLKDPLGWVFKALRNFFCGIVGGTPLAIPKYIWRQQQLKDNPHFQLTTAIVERYKELGGKVTGKRWMEYQEYFNRLTIGAGRLLHELPMIQSEWRTVTDFACCSYGIPAVTTESFPVAEIGIRGIEDRVKAQYLYTVATLDILNQRGE